MSTSRYRLSIISKSPQTLDRPLLPYEVGGEQVIGAFDQEIENLQKNWIGDPGLVTTIKG